MISITFIFLILITIVSLRPIKGFISLPIGIRHLLHLIITPKDLYEPIVIDNFQFYEKGFSKTYLLQLKYLDIYEVGFFSDKKDIQATYKFQGKLKAEFFYEDKFLFEKMATSWRTAEYVDGDMKYFKKISLIDFEIPIKGRYKENISVKLTVLEPDKQSEIFGDSIKLYISVSAIP